MVSARSAANVVDARAKPVVTTPRTAKTATHPVTKHAPKHRKTAAKPHAPMRRAKCAKAAVVDVVAVGVVAMTVVPVPMAWATDLRLKASKRNWVSHPKPPSGHLLNPAIQPSAMTMAKSAKSVHGTVMVANVLRAKSAASAATSQSRKPRPPKAIST